MIVRHIIEDLESLFVTNPQTKDYDLAFACYKKDEPGKIEFQEIEAFHWDEDDEFFLVPSGNGKYYELTSQKYKSSSFLAQLKAIKKPDVSEFVAYARHKTKIAKDGSIASLNSPLWGTGFHDQENLLYFYHGEQP